MNEKIRIALRVLLLLIAVYAGLRMVGAARYGDPNPDPGTSPICLTIAVAGLACSCRPVGLG